MNEDAINKTLLICVLQFSFFKRSNWITIRDIGKKTPNNLKDVAIAEKKQNKKIFLFLLFYNILKQKYVDIIVKLRKIISLLF